jgi:hypothetical protein
MPVFSLQIPHGLVWDQTRASAVFKETNYCKNDYDLTLRCPHRNEDAASSL